MKTEPKGGYPSSSQGPAAAAAAAAAAGTDAAKPNPPQWDGDPSTLQPFMKLAEEFPALLRRWEMDQILLRQRRLPEFFKMDAAQTASASMASSQSSMCGWQMPGTRIPIPTTPRGEDLMDESAKKTHLLENPDKAMPRETRAKTPTRR